MRVVDLFCGAGGLSTGFEQAGFEVVVGADVDEAAIETWSHNHDGEGVCIDLTETSPEAFCEAYVDPDTVDGVIGGPPCQGFSIAYHDRSADDERNNLVFVFADYVRHIQPEFFLMENVEGITNIDDGTILDTLLAEFEAAGYYVHYELLNAADYGVPQKRKRVFVVGYKTLPERWFPPRTHASREEIEAAKAEVADE